MLNLTYRFQRNDVILYDSQLLLV